MRTALLAALVATCVSCGDDGTTVLGPSTGAGNAVPLTQDIDRDGFLRALDGDAVLSLPTLGKGWTVTRTEPKGGVMVKLVYSGGASVDIAMARNKNGAADARALAEEAAAQLIAQRPGTTRRGGSAFDHPGGSSSYRVALESRAPNGTSLAVGIMAITDGAVAATIFTVAPPALYEQPEVAGVLSQIRVAIGNKVPTISAPAPDKPIEGVFIWTGNKLGDYEAYVFDRRGVFHDNLATTLDMDAYYQKNPLAVARYEFDGKNLTLIIGGTSSAPEPVKYDGKVLEVRGDKYYRADGQVKDGTRLDGYWDASTYSSSTGGATSSTAFIQRGYTFTSAGQVQTSSFVGVSSWNTPGSSSPTGGGAAYKQGAPTAGRYEIAHDRLNVTYPDGRVGLVTIYPFMTNSGPDLDILYIGGRSYLKD